MNYWRMAFRWGTQGDELWQGMRDSHHISWQRQGQRATRWLCHSLKLQATSPQLAQAQAQAL